MPDFYEFLCDWHEGFSRRLIPIFPLCLLQKRFDSNLYIENTVEFPPYLRRHASKSNANDTRPRNRRQNARKLASVSGASVMQSGAKFFWRQILELNRTVFYFATESGDHVIKILIRDWSVINAVGCFRLLEL